MKEVKKVTDTQPKAPKKVNPQKAVARTTKIVSPRAKVKKPTQKKAAVTIHSDKTCRIVSCKRVYRAKGYCRVHYKKWRKGEFGNARFKRCHAVECRAPMVKNLHGFCDEHYQKFYTGKEEAPRPQPAAKTEQKATTA